jgi:hypothetical protein
MAAWSRPSTSSSANASARVRSWAVRHATTRPASAGVGGGRQPGNTAQRAPHVAVTTSCSHRCWHGLVDRSASVHRGGGQACHRTPTPSGLFVALPLVWQRIGATATGRIPAPALGALLWARLVRPLCSLAGAGRGGSDFLSEFSIPMQAVVSGSYRCSIFRATLISARCSTAWQSAHNPVPFQVTVAGFVQWRMGRILPGRSSVPGSMATS